MDTIIDLWGAFVVGGMILLAIITLNIDMSDTATRMTHDLVVQEDMVELVRMIHYDFYKIGYGAPSGVAILSGDSSRITFLTDIDDDGNVDSIKYYLGSASGLTATPNPKDRLLYRVLNEEVPRASSMGVVAFDLTFYDSVETQTAVLANIRSIKVSLDVESPYPYIDTTFVKYAGIHWEDYIDPANIQ